MTPMVPSLKSASPLTHGSSDSAMRLSSPCAPELTFRRCTTAWPRFPTGSSGSVLVPASGGRMPARLKRSRLSRSPWPTGPSAVRRAGLLRPTHVCGALRRRWNRDGSRGSGSGRRPNPPPMLHPPTSCPGTPPRVSRFGAPSAPAPLGQTSIPVSHSAYVLNTRTSWAAAFPRRRCAPSQRPSSTRIRPSADRIALPHSALSTAQTLDRKSMRPRWTGPLQTQTRLTAGPAPMATRMHLRIRRRRTPAQTERPLMLLFPTHTCRRRETRAWRRSTRRHLELPARRAPVPAPRQRTLSPRARRFTCSPSWPSWAAVPMPPAAQPRSCSPLRISQPPSPTPAACRSSSRRPVPRVNPTSRSSSLAWWLASSRQPPCIAADLRVGVISIRTCREPSCCRVSSGARPVGPRAVVIARRTSAPCPAHHRRHESHQRSLPCALSSLRFAPALLALRTGVAASRTSAFCHAHRPRCESHQRSLPGAPSSLRGTPALLARRTVLAASRTSAPCPAHRRRCGSHQRLARRNGVAASRTSAPSPAHCVAASRTSAPCPASRRRCESHQRSVPCPPSSLRVAPALRPLRTVLAPSRTSAPSPASGEAPTPTNRSSWQAWP